MGETAYETSTLEHLGLVSGMIDELGIVDLIDATIKQDLEQKLVSVGLVVKALVLIGLGFTRRRLYLVPHFFKNKPTERLLGVGVTPEMINDDALGRALDALHAFGVTRLFSLISHQTVTKLGLAPSTVHLDSTSFHVDGEYQERPKKEKGAGKVASGAGASEGVVGITHGYSRDHRPDLNQVGLALIAESRAGLPLLMKPLSGNENDHAAFASIVNEHVSNLVDAGVKAVVMDNAGYTPKIIGKLSSSGVTWVMSVPTGNLKAAKELVNRDDLKFEPLALPDAASESEAAEAAAALAGYSAASVTTSYAGVQQRWLVIESTAASKRGAKRAPTQLLALADKERKAFKRLCKVEYSCEADALTALTAFKTRATLVEVHEASVTTRAHHSKRGRPRKGATPERITYRLSGYLAVPVAAREERVSVASRFILATNDVTGTVLSPAEVLLAYKGQAKVERGFRFVKDPTFSASTIFLKNPERIMALLFVMSACLLVYAALEHRIRTALGEADEGVPDQKGKPTNKPTARWVFELFSDVHILTIQPRGPAPSTTLIMNLDERLKPLLACLGPTYSRAYA